MDAVKRVLSSMLLVKSIASERIEMDQVSAAFYYLTFRLHGKVT